MLRLTALAALMLVAAAPMTVEDDNAAVRAAADAFDRAQQQRDGTALDRLLAPDFLIVHGSGKVGDRREFIDGFTEPGVMLEPFRITDRLFLRIAPDAAVVGGEAVIRGTEDGKAFAERFRYADTFARRDGRWMVVFTQVTPLPAP